MYNAKCKTMKTIYINRKGQGYLETVDEFPYNNKDERKEAARCLREYRFGDPSAYFYFSKRCTKEWRDK
jgi:hypothetical protein